MSKHQIQCERENKRVDAERPNLFYEVKFSGASGDRGIIFSLFSCPQAGLATISVDAQSTICEHFTYACTP